MWPLFIDLVNLLQTLFWRSFLQLSTRFGALHPAFLAPNYIGWTTIKIQRKHSTFVYKAYKQSYYQKGAAWCFLQHCWQRMRHLEHNYRTSVQRSIGELRNSFHRQLKKILTVCSAGSLVFLWVRNFISPRKYVVSRVAICM